MKLNKVVNLRLGAQSVPFHNLKRDPWSALFGFFGDMLDSADVKATNEANQWQNIVTNQANMEMNEQQLAWAREQYEMEKAENRYLIDQAYYRDIEQRDNEREYNSPAMQMERFKAAGINPALAMYGGAGSVGAGGVGSVRSSTGQNPHANQPNMIPMQSGAPAIPYTGFGQGIRDAVSLYYQGRESEREDYRLASDITFKDYETRMKYLGYLLDKNKDARDDRFIKHQMLQADKNFKLESDKFERQIQWENFQHEVINYQIKQRDVELQLQTLATQSGIRLDGAQIKGILQAAKESWVRADSIAMHDDLDERQFQQLVTDLAWKRIMSDKMYELDKDLQGSKKFSNYVSGVVQTVGTGLGIYLGLKGAGSASYRNTLYPRSSGSLGYGSFNLPKYGVQY